MSKVYKYILLETEHIYTNYDDYHTVVRNAFQGNCEESVIEIPEEENNVFNAFARSRGLVPVRLLSGDETTDLKKLYEEYRNKKYEADLKKKEKAEAAAKKRQITLQNKRLKEEQEKIEAAKQLLRDKGLLSE